MMSRVLVLVALGYSLFLWLVLVFTIIYYDFSSFREYWSTPSFFGVSNFQVSMLVGFLYTGLLVLSFVEERRTTGVWPRGSLIVYAVNLGIVAVWAVNFYGMADFPLNDAWYHKAIADEPYDDHGVFLGQVLSTHPCGSCPDGTASITVGLETGKIVEVNVSGAETPVGSIVGIRERRARFTGSRRYEFDIAVDVEDAELFKRRWFRNPEK